MGAANDNAPQPRAYYNEFDPKAAAWLRELIKQGEIAPGDVDERSIVDVRPADLAGYTQCHFFAGIGVWSHALRRAGWSDANPVWTGSCPCQPFSAAGKGDGFDDERHLWPHFYWLISQCRPPVVAGEQVASKDADPWIDLVQSDLEALGYAVGATPFPSAGVGAPHIRDRLYWVADANSGQFDGQSVLRGTERDGEDPGRSQGGGELGPRIENGRLADTERNGSTAGLSASTRGHEGSAEKLGDGGRGRLGPDARRSRNDGLGRLANDTPSGRGEECTDLRGQSVRDRTEGEPSGLGASRRNSWPGPTNGLWGDVDWLFCRDGKWRPVEPGTFPLAHGAPARVGRLRGYGNAINAEAATVFIEAYLESRQ